MEAEYIYIYWYVLTEAEYFCMYFCMYLRRLKLRVLISVASKVTPETKFIAHVYKHEFAARLRRSTVSEKNDFATAQMFRTSTVECW